MFRDLVRRRNICQTIMPMLFGIIRGNFLKNLLQLLKHKERQKCSCKFSRVEFWTNQDHFALRVLVSKSTGNSKTMVMHWTCWKRSKSWISARNRKDRHAVVIWGLSSVPFRKLCCRCSSITSKYYIQHIYFRPCVIKVILTVKCQNNICQVSCVHVAIPTWCYQPTSCHRKQSVNTTGPLVIKSVGASPLLFQMITTCSDTRGIKCGVRLCLRAEAP